MAKRDSSSDLIDHVLLGGLLSLLTLRVTITESPAVPQSTMALTLADPLYSVLVSCALLALCALWWLRHLITHPSRYRSTGLGIGLGLLIITAIISSCFAADKRLAINHTLIFLAPAMAGLVLIQLLDRPGRIRLVLIFLTVLGILAAVHGFGQFTSGNSDMIEQYQKDPESLLAPLGIDPNTLQQFLFEHRLHSRGVRSYFTTRNSAGCFALIALFAALTLSTYRPREAQDRQAKAIARASHGLYILVIGTGLILSRSKAGFLGLGAGLMAWGLGQRYGPWFARHRIPVITVLLVLGLIGVGVLGYYGNQHSRLPGGHSMMVRWQYWQATARMIVDHPWLGVGPGNFASWYQHYKVPEALEAVADPHNLPLSILAQYGPAGLLGLLALILGPIRRRTRPCEDAHRVTNTTNGTPKAYIVLVGCALVTALWILHPVFAPLPITHQLIVKLYLIGTQRILPLLIGLGVAQWLLRPTIIGTDRPQKASLLPACGVLAALVANLTDFALFEPSILMSLWFLGACALASKIPPAIQPPAPLKQSVRITGICGLLVAGGTIYNLAVRPTATGTRWLSQAQGALERGHFTQAHHDLAQATKSDPWSSLASATAGRVYLAQDRSNKVPDQQLLAKAATYLKMAQQRHPADYRNYERLGHVYERMGDWELAYQAYQYACTRYPSKARLWLALGKVAEKRGNHSEAVLHYQEAIAIEDRFRDHFAHTYPQQKTPISRLGFEAYQFAQDRIKALKR